MPAFAREADDSSTPHAVRPAANQAHFTGRYVDSVPVYRLPSVNVHASRNRETISRDDELRVARPAVKRSTRPAA